jgi:hypothetical protein
MIETREPVDPAGLVAILGPCVRTATTDGVTRVWCDDDAKVSDEQLAAAVAEHVPVQAPLDQHAQTLVLLAVKGYITEDEAAAVSGRPKADLVAEAEAWAVAAEVKR